MNLQNQLVEMENLNYDNLNNFLIEIKDKIDLLEQNNDIKFSQLDDKIKNILLSFLNIDLGDKTLSDDDIKELIKNTYVTRVMLEEHLNKLHVTINKNINEEILKLNGFLVDGVNTKIKEQIFTTMKEQTSLNAENKGIIDIDDGEIRRIVKEMLATYDADKTGLVDYALESAGGQILSIRCTENYHTKSAQISIFGIPLWYPSNTPRIAISPSVQPGQCWAFQGFPGFLVLKLNSLIVVSGFTLEHIPKSLTPNNKIDSAPKAFTVWGLHEENDPEPFLFGTYEYVDSGNALQYFAIQNSPKENVPYQIVELRIESNHGNPKYTCLYRFRVHGTSLL